MRLKKINIIFNNIIMDTSENIKIKISEEELVKNQEKEAAAAKKKAEKEAAAAKKKAEKEAAKKKAEEEASKKKAEEEAAKKKAEEEAAAKKKAEEEAAAKKKAEEEAAKKKAKEEAAAKKKAEEEAAKKKAEEEAAKKKAKEEAAKKKAKEEAAAKKKAEEEAAKKKAEEEAAKKKAEEEAAAKKKAEEEAARKRSIIKKDLLMNTTFSDVESWYSLFTQHSNSIELTWNEKTYCPLKSRSEFVDESKTKVYININNHKNVVVTCSDVDMESMGEFMNSDPAMKEMTQDFNWNIDPPKILENVNTSDVSNLMIQYKVSDFHKWYKGFSKHGQTRSYLNSNRYLLPYKRSDLCDEKRTQIFRSKTSDNDVLILLYDVNIPKFMSLNTHRNMRVNVSHCGQLSSQTIKTF